MIKGTDLVMGVQILIMRYTYLLSNYKKTVSDKLAVNGQNIGVLGGIDKLFLFREELRQHLCNLGNEEGHNNMDSLKEFVEEKQLPPLPLNEFKTWVYKTVETQLLVLIENYQRILMMRSLPIAVEAVLLRHLAELQSTTCDFIKKLQQLNDGENIEEGEFMLA